MEFQNIEKYLVEIVEANLFPPISFTMENAKAEDIGVVSHGVMNPIVSSDSTVSSSELDNRLTFNISQKEIQDDKADRGLLESNEYPNTYFQDYCGLRSSDPVKKFKAQKIFGCFCALSIAMILISLFVIIPAVITSIVDKSTLDVESVTLQYPTNTSFQSTTVQKFDGAGSLKAKAKLGTLAVYWENAGTSTQVIDLSSSGTITVGGSAPITMTSQALVVNEQAMSDMLLYAVDATTLNWGMQGSADITFITSTKVYLDKSVSLDGYQDFPVAPVIHSVSTVSGVGNTLTTSIYSTLTSVASMEMHLGQNMYFSVKSNGTVVGSGMMPNFVMYTGSFSINATVNLTYSNTAEYNQVMRVMSNFSMGLESPLTLFDFHLEDPIVWLSPALLSMSMNSSMPGATESFLQMFYLFNKIPPIDVPFEMVIYNPETIPVTVQDIVGVLIYQGVIIANVNETNISIYCPPGVNTTSPKMISSSTLSGPTLEKFNELLENGGGLVDTIGEFHITKTVFVHYGAVHCTVLYCTAPWCYTTCVALPVLRDVLSSFVNTINSVLTLMCLCVCVFSVS
mgnify:FL=1